MRLILRTPNEAVVSAGLPFAGLGPSRWNPTSFVVSIVLHGVFLFILSVLPSPQSSKDRNILPQERRSQKMILTFRRYEPLPKVTPPQSTPRAEVSRGRTLTRSQAVIANLDKKPVHQINWTPPPAVKRDPTPSEDLVKIPLAAVPAPPALQPPPSPRAFVAPPALQPKKTRSALEIPLGDAPELRPVEQNFKSSAVLQASTRAVPKPVRQIGSADAPPELAGNDPRAPSPVVILNSAPSTAPPAPDPSAARSGQIARAGEIGSPALRNSAPNGVRVPGVGIDKIGTTVLPDAPARAKEVKPVREIQYQRSLLGGAENSVSIPLRPRVRTVPADIERVFAGKNAYTMLIPMTNNPEYSGDWAIWFGERGTPSPEGRVMAPVPLVKRSVLRPSGGRVEEGRVRAQLVLDVEGKVLDVKLLSCSNPNLRNRALADIQEWQFRPARKSGAPFAADVILDLTLRCQVAEGE